MSLVVAQGRMSFAIRAEVNVITNGTFIANPSDIALRWLALAQRPIAEDAIVNLKAARRVSDGIVERYKTMTRVID